MNRVKQPRGRSKQPAAAEEQARRMVEQQDWARRIAERLEHGARAMGPDGALPRENDAGSVPR